MRILVERVSFGRNGEEGKKRWRWGGWGRFGEKSSDSIGLRCLLTVVKNFFSIFPLILSLSLTFSLGLFH